MKPMPSREETMDRAEKHRVAGMVEEFRKFYDENGYLPHKAALRLIEIAEQLLSSAPREEPKK